MHVNQILECEGLACPMPVVKTKKAMESINPGEVLEVRVTDQGSVADLKSWAKRTGHQYIGLKEEGSIYRHFIRKGVPEEMKVETSHAQTMLNEELHQKLSAKIAVRILDVREPAEYAFGHIPGALSIPLGELEHRYQELDSNAPYVVICRTGRRSDLACQLLSDKGFKDVTNVLPGMSEWSYEVEKG